MKFITVGAKLLCGSDLQLSSPYTTLPACEFTNNSLFRYTSFGQSALHHFFREGQTTKQELLSTRWQIFHERVLAELRWWSNICMLKTLLCLGLIHKLVFQRCRRVHRCVGSTSFFWQGTTQAVPKHEYENAKCLLTTSNVSLHQSKAKSSGQLSVLQPSCGTKPALCCCVSTSTRDKKPSLHGAAGEEFLHNDPYCWKQW